MAKLPLNDDQRHAFASHLDGMGMPELMGREAPPDPRLDGGSSAGPLVRRRSTSADRVSDG